MVPLLAPETIDTIIDNLHSDKPSLLACSLTAKQWLPCSRYHLFSKVHIRPTNIESFLKLVDDPKSTISMLMQHLLVNGFSKSIIALGNKAAKEQLKQLTLRLRKVKYLRMLNSLELTPEYLSGLSNVRDLEFSQMCFKSLDDALDVVYAFPLLRSFSMNSISIINPHQKPYSRPPGEASAFHIREIKGFLSTLPGFSDWLLALNPVPPIHSVMLDGFDDDQVGTESKLLQSIGPHVRSLTIFMENIEDGMEASRHFIDPIHCTNLRTLTITSICTLYDPINGITPGYLWVNQLFSRVSSKNLEELVFLFQEYAHIPGWSDTFDWKVLAQVTSQLQFKTLRSVKIIPHFTAHMQREDMDRIISLEESLKAGPLRPLEARGILEFFLENK